MIRRTTVTEQPILPGGVGVSRLRVYPWASGDELAGGSPHMHLTCTECYLVLSGTGELHTLTVAGLRRTPLQAGDAVWFTPGTIHRAVNVDRLQVQVLMQNDGLPEAGDAVLTFPRQHLATIETYAAAMSLGEGDHLEREQRARQRRDLAIHGFTAIADDVQRGNATTLEQFYRDAAALVADRLDAWEKAWRAKAFAAAVRTGEQIDALRRGDVEHLRAAAVARLSTPQEDTLGMCGFLAPYRREQADTA
jgi:mannose-6-phosphate isomerase-like protein (cupin superfamily)